MKHNSSCFELHENKFLSLQLHVFVLIRQNIIFYNTKLIHRYLIIELNCKIIKFVKEEEKNIIFETEFVCQTFVWEHLYFYDFEYRKVCKINAYVLLNPTVKIILISSQGNNYKSKTTGHEKTASLPFVIRHNTDHYM